MKCMDWQPILCNNGIVKSLHEIEPYAHIFQSHIPMISVLINVLSKIHTIQSRMMLFIMNFTYYYKRTSFVSHHINITPPPVI